MSLIGDAGLKLNYYGSPIIVNTSAQMIQIKQSIEQNKIGFESMIYYYIGEDDIVNETESEVIPSNSLVYFDGYKWRIIDNIKLTVDYNNAKSGVPADSASFKAYLDKCLKYQINFPNNAIHKESGIIKFIDLNNISNNSEYITGVWALYNDKEVGIDKEAFYKSEKYSADAPLYKIDDPVPGKGTLRYLIQIVADGAFAGCIFQILYGNNGAVWTRRKNYRNDNFYWTGWSGGIDSSLTIQYAAADAQVVGTKFENVNYQIKQLTDSVTAINTNIVNIQKDLVKDNILQYYESFADCSGFSGSATEGYRIDLSKIQKKGSDEYLTGIWGIYSNSEDKYTFYDLDTELPSFVNDGLMRFFIQIAGRNAFDLDIFQLLCGRNGEIYSRLGVKSGANNIRWESWQSMQSRIDDTLSKTKYAADAKAVGDKFNTIENQFTFIPQIDDKVLGKGTDLNDCLENKIYFLSPSYNYEHLPDNAFIRISQNEDGLIKYYPKQTLNLIILCSPSKKTIYQILNCQNGQICFREQIENTWSDWSIPLSQQVDEINNILYNGSDRADKTPNVLVRYTPSFIPEPDKFNLYDMPANSYMYLTMDKIKLEQLPEIYKKIDAPPIFSTDLVYIMRLSKSSSGRVSIYFMNCNKGGILKSFIAEHQYKTEAVEKDFEWKEFCFDVDVTLKKAGVAAEAQIVGEKFEDINNKINKIPYIAGNLSSDEIDDLNNIDTNITYFLSPIQEYKNLPKKEYATFNLDSEKKPQGKPKQALCLITMCSATNKTIYQTLIGAEGNIYSRVRLGSLDDGTAVWSNWKNIMTNNLINMESPSNEDDSFSNKNNSFYFLGTNLGLTKAMQNGETIDDTDYIEGNNPIPQITSKEDILYNGSTPNWETEDETEYIAAYKKSFMPFIFSDDKNLLPEATQSFIFRNHVLNHSFTTAKGKKYTCKIRCSQTVDKEVYKKLLPSDKSFPYYVTQQLNGTEYLLNSNHSYNAYPDKWLDEDATKIYGYSSIQENNKYYMKTKKNYNRILNQSFDNLFLTRKAYISSIRRYTLEQCQKTLEEFCKIFNLTNFEIRLDGRDITENELQTLFEYGIPIEEEEKDKIILDRYREFLILIQDNNRPSNLIIDSQPMFGRNINLLSNKNNNILILMLGENDFLYNRPIGNFDETYLKNNGSYEALDETTFIGAYIYFLNQLFAKYPTIKVYCCTIPPLIMTTPLLQSYDKEKKQFQSNFTATTAFINNSYTPVSIHNLICDKPLESETPLDWSGLEPQLSMKDQDAVNTLEESRPTLLLAQYNQAIKKVAALFGISVIDLDTCFNAFNIDNYVQEYGHRLTKNDEKKADFEVYYRYLNERGQKLIANKIISTIQNDNLIM